MKRLLIPILLAFLLVLMGGSYNIEFGAKAPKDTYISLLKINTPQYELFLKESTPMKGSYGKRRYANSVVFRADEPNKLMEDIQSKR